MRLPFLIPLLAIFNVVQSISFVNPGPFTNDSVYTLDPSFPYGSQIDIQWTPTSDTISLVIYQQTQDAVFEYVFQNKKGISHYDWDITTTKSLAVSRIFFFEIFIEGETGPTAVSHYFNITGNPSDSVSSSTSQSTSPAANPTTAGTAITTASKAGLAPSATSASATPTPSPNGGLSLGAKVAIGVAIPVAAIAGVIAGWFFFGRKRRAKKQEQNQQNQENNTQWHPSMQSYYKPQNEVYAHHKQPPGEMESPHQGPVYNPQELASSPLHSPAELPSDRHK